ncbi:MAG: hypothetical protein K9J37_06365 [Saprospiraceae bacterium]|nr:hypothetical protein [Saprospiraceae bacterium]MCF8249516.1 hypothetical protein [Saprospiraceae bacterium]MCF8280141.1 hypothetical protein [Bacteroidales bacterium]MCF8310734.1 hypothetical protein [Saprospiraceae bacterium]MCF8439435.1 hypothetical protein [Saprospiraceae bacterium]
MEDSAAGGMWRNYVFLCSYVFQKEYCFAFYLSSEFYRKALTKSGVEVSEERQFFRCRLICLGFPPSKNTSLAAHPPAQLLTPVALLTMNFV